MAKNKRYTESMEAASKLCIKMGVNILIVNIPKEAYEHDSYDRVDIMLETHCATNLGSWMPSNDRSYWYEQDRCGCDYKIQHEVEYETLLSVIRIGGE